MQPREKALANQLLLPPRSLPLPPLIPTSKSSALQKTPDSAAVAVAVRRTRSGGKGSGDGAVATVDADVAVAGSARGGRKRKAEEDVHA